MLNPEDSHDILRKTGKAGSFMSIEITIKQKLFSRKPMPLETILGDQLAYGFWENDQLSVGKLGDTEFIAYDPEAIGRGFSVIWNPQEKKSISLRLPSPSTAQEIRALFDCVDRMVNYWGGSLIVDGTHLKPQAFLSSYDDFVSFNGMFLNHVCTQVLEGEHEKITLYSAKWALSIGREEAERFMKTPNEFTSWLHEKQAMDVFYCNPRFFMGDDGVFGQYMLMNDLPTVFPLKPTVPFGTTDPNTGKPLECEKWTVLLVLEHDKEFMKELDYQVFLDWIPAERKIRYDGSHFLIEGFTRHDILELANAI